MILPQAPGGRCRRCNMLVADSAGPDDAVSFSDAQKREGMATGNGPGTRTVGPRNKNAHLHERALREACQRRGPTQRANEQAWRLELLATTFSRRFAPGHAAMPGAPLLRQQTLSAWASAGFPLAASPESPGNSA